jgi:hypothetical protein
MNPLTLAGCENTGRQLTYAEAIASQRATRSCNMAIALSLHAWNNTAQDYCDWRRPS